MAAHPRAPQSMALMALDGRERDGRPLEAAEDGRPIRQRSPADPRTGVGLAAMVTVEDAVRTQDTARGFPKRDLRREAELCRRLARRDALRAPERLSGRPSGIFYALEGFAKKRRF